MGARAKYFTVEDMRCRSGARYPVEWEATRLQRLFNVMDAIRDHIAEPLVVVCGYRTLGYNKALREASLKRNGGTSGVAIHSQHTEGMAADIRPLKVSRFNVDVLHDMTLQMYADGKIQDLGGLGYYPSQWIHIDIRDKPDGKLIRWDGNGGGDGQST